MAKIQVYKFVNPGVASIKTPAVVAARQTVLAQNRLGKTVEGIGNTLLDVDKITKLRLNLEKKQDIAERRAKQRKLDDTSEQVSEKGLKNYFKDTKKKTKRFKPNNKLKKMFGGMFGWVGAALGPFIALATKIFALQLMKEFLEWTSNEENLVKLETFLIKTDFVFRKLYGFGKFLIKDNIVDGINQLFGSDETLLGRIEGLGKIMVGVIGLKYLMNPFSLITDILTMANIISGGGKGKKFIKNQTGNVTGNVKKRITTSSGKTVTKNPFVKLGDKLRQLNPLKKKPTVTQSGATKGNFFSNLFKKKPTVTQSSSNPKGNLFSKTKSFLNKGKPLLSKVKPGQVVGGVKSFGVGLALDWAVGSIADTLIFNPMEERLNKKREAKVNEKFLELGSEGVVKFYEDHLAKENSKKGLNWWQNAATLGFGNIFVGPSEPKVRDLEYKLNYAKEITTNQETNLESLFKPKEEKKKAWWDPLGVFTGKARGGKLPQFFLGGLFKGISKAVSGVFNGVKSVVGSVWNAVSSVASNPIVSTIASFIPGANIIVPAINAVNALRSGNFMGAVMSGLGAVGSFASINSVNMINQPSWLQNLRFSKFGQGVAKMYHSGLNAYTKLAGGVSNLFDKVQGSTIGKIGMQLLGGNTGGAIGTVVGMMPGVGSGIENFGKFLEENKLSGILSAVPGVAGMASKIPNILAIPGMESILGKPGEGFSALGAIGNMADKVGMKGVYQAILSGAQTGNYIEGLPQLASELGVDPRILGVLDKGKQLLSNNKFNAEYAMQTAIEFLPVPLVVEKIVAAPTPVPINSGDTYLVAPSSTSGAKR